MDLQFIMLAWTVLGAIIGGVIGRASLGPRPRDFGPQAFMGALGACSLGFLTYGVLAGLGVRWSVVFSIIAAVIGAAIASGAMAMVQRPHREDRLSS